MKSEFTDADQKSAEDGTDVKRARQLTRALSKRSAKKGVKRSKAERAKVFIRNYEMRARFKSGAEFDTWLEEQVKENPWYLCSSYRGGGVDKRIYACSFRKRAGFAKCERQLMVEFHDDGAVVVLDSSVEKTHVHVATDTVGETRKFRLLAQLENGEELKNWLSSQSDRFVWHKRPGRRASSGIEYYQCGYRNAEGDLCGRLLTVEHKEDGSVSVMEFEGQPQHNHTEPSKNSAESVKSAKRPRLEIECQDSSEGTSCSVNEASLRPLDGGQSSSSTDVPLVEERVKVEPAVQPARVEDFVIIADDDEEDEIRECESRGPNTADSESGGGSTKNHGTVDALFYTPPRTDGVDLETLSEWNGFSTILTQKLQDTPLERLPAVRANMRYEMDSIFAKQVIDEIISRGYSPGNGRQLKERLLAIFE